MLELKQSVLHKILKDFYTLTKIRITLWDSDFQEILCYPEARSEFCSLIRQDDAINEQCVACDIAACRRCARTKKLVLYRCHAGLTEAVVPMQDRFSTIGYILFGQIIPEKTDKAVKSDLFRSFSEERFPGIGTAIEAISVKSEEELSATATVLQALTTYVLENQWVMPKKADFIRQLDSYIQRNLEESITVDAICADFRIGRSRLYDVAEKFLGCGVAEYVRKKKIEAAQRLLRETDLTIGAIAEATGFSDYNYFSRVFRKETGLSARAYRQEQGR